jgi:predicted CXXCH cytochrome family protein
MHNSQDGSAIDAAGPSRSLTIGGCVGCHTGTNDGTNSNIPFVNQTGAPSYVSGAGATNPTLAGGSFYWVDTAGGATDSKGHNVVGIAGADAILGQTPPAFNATTAGEVGIGTSWSTAGNQLTCAGTYGCHGPHVAPDDFTDLSGAHHGDDSVIDGTTIASSFRFLEGIIGVEDPDWEYSASTTDRNVYHGEARTDASLNADKATISYFCSTCHGDYHAGAGVVYGGSTIGTNPWLRHPTDYDMAATDQTAEYRGYTTYSVEAPVAADTTTTVNSISAQNTALGTMANATPTANAAIVTCVSCHRAHGSPYADLLRWDYAGMDAGTTVTANAGTGCFNCHTTKDGL